MLTDKRNKNSLYSMTLEDLYDGIFFSLKGGNNSLFQNVTNETADTIIQYSIFKRLLYLYSLIFIDLAVLFLILLFLVILKNKNWTARCLLNFVRKSTQEYPINMKDKGVLVCNKEEITNVAFVFQAIIGADLI